ncbi:MAG: histidinol phosphate phosphatase domain-containing protein [Chloroflexi bacterium]|nr:histidinol phosphate phosphatase domain-containing protein [Chloroflexota bacterium]
MISDFHTHSCLSDGQLSPVELARRALVNGYKAIAITDHTGIGSLGRVLREVAEDCALVRRHWNIAALPGVELTHVPAQAIAETAKKAKEMGAWLVLVHGETVVEPVEKGTNLAAASSHHVDILAHPGLLTPEEARLAANNRIFIELTARKGHCLTNGHVVRIAQQAQARLLLNSDAHDSDDLLTSELALAIARGAGLEDPAIKNVLDDNPQLLLARMPAIALK